MNPRLLIAALTLACAPAALPGGPLLGQAAPPSLVLTASGPGSAGDSIGLDLTLPAPASGLQTYWLVSTSGQGHNLGPCFPALAGDCIDIISPTVFDQTVSASGLSSTTVDLPSGPDTLWFQAAVVYQGRGYLSAPLEYAIGAVGGGSGDTCGDAIVVPTGGAIYLGSNSGFTNTYSSPTGCTNYSSPGPDVVYEVTLPAGANLDALIDDAPGGVSADWSLWLSDDCAAGTCLVGQDNGTPEEITYRNNTGAAQVVYLIADGYASTSVGDYELVIDVSSGVCGDGTVDPSEQCDGNDVGGEVCSDGVTPPICNSLCELDLSTCPELVGETCGNPIVVPATGGSYQGDTSDFMDDYSAPAPGCTGYGSQGPDVVYEVTVLPGVMLDATLANNSSSPSPDWSLWVSEDCAAGTCLVGADSGGPESISYVNNTGLTQVLYVIADGYGTNSFGPYQLDIVLN